LAALEKGKKPVLCEKPMGLSVAESELMAKTARQQGLFLMEVNLKK
jgi:predicted dehydrogenase